MAQDDGYTDIGQRVRVGFLLVQGGLSIPGGDSAGHQSFTYTATGLEGASFVLVFPVARSNANYVVHAGGAGLADFLVFDCPKAQYLADRFRLDCSAAPQAGDVIAITVEDL